MIQKNQDSGLKILFQGFDSKLSSWNLDSLKARTSKNDTFNDNLMNHVTSSTN